jgi:hypothetical protein
VGELSDLDVVDDPSLAETLEREARTAGAAKA